MPTSEASMDSCVHYNKMDGIVTNSPSFVKLLVGPNRELFEIPEDLLCLRCPFFLNAFNGNFIESKTKIFSFPDDDPERFADLCTWLRTGSLSPAEGNTSWIWLAKIWLFGDKYHIDELQNEVIDALHTKFAAHREGVNISFETLDYIAEHAFPRSPLRRIFADMLANGISLQQLPKRLENIPAEFLQDICLALKTIVALNGPANINLLTNPISTYYTSSSSCKATAMPQHTDKPGFLYCRGPECEARENPEPIQGSIYVCSNHNIILCEKCRDTHRGHRKKMFTVTSPPYQSSVTGDETTIIDVQLNDHGFFCDGPDCGAKGEAQARYERLEYWTLASGDRYHCLKCENTDYCSLCIRRPLECKDAGHEMLRIRPTFLRKIPLTEDVMIQSRQERSQKGSCWRCGDDAHGTNDCDAKQAVLGPDVQVED